MNRGKASLNRRGSPDPTADGSKADPLAFEVILENAMNWGADGSGLKGRTVVVEVEGRGLPEALAVTADPLDAAPDEAEALACRAARQTVKKDLPDGVEPACL